MSYVVDSSAVIALLKDETGAEFVREHISNSYVSSVNLAEISTYLIRQGTPEGIVRDTLLSIPYNIIPFDKEQALTTGFLHLHGKKLGLSLGDRSCIALAKSLGFTVLTGDRVWKELQYSIEIKIFR